ncbi:exodeoxyribonuclease V subunit beta [Hydrocarboniphaga sp.]|uniref:exodeoxyribonuclease V subunit beta n=1 Tax=Hydrocarboniphaga sp. TaxID=2033016 RepID=UPI002611F7B6|nr:exodeoxyribonuclease V subunit beta [Hydrocarboniphaga sp.]
MPVALTAPLDGLRLIEASAGTGKTWTLSGLYLRLVVERGIGVDKILAVTFTKAATAELRDRIRARLRQMLDHLEGSIEGRDSSDEFCEQLLARLDDRALAARRLQAALRSVDEAAIYTIHGFCQRVLGDRAFSTGVAFDNEIAPDQSELRREVVLDFWRRRIAHDDPAESDSRDLFVAWLQNEKVSAGELTRWVSGLIGKPDLQIVAAEPPPPVEDRCRSYRVLREQAAALWQQQREALCRQLNEHKGLNRQSYNLKHLPKRFVELEAWLAATDEIAMPSAVECFRASVLAGKNKGEALREEFYQLLDQLHDAAATLAAAFEQRWRALRLELLDYARTQLPARLRAQRLLSYDDLLLELHTGLQGEGGETLAADLRRRYPAALIDEFQDTDPLQWGIVKRIYADGLQAGEMLTAFLVGDPKQSIYSFRGADIYSYLAAKSLCSEHHELSENQRSVPGYVQALNTLYARVASPFQNDEIRYQTVVASPRDKPALIEHGEIDPAPLRLLFMPESDGAAKTHGEAWAAQACAIEIAGLLADAQAGGIEYKNRSLASGDIAVLVNNHYQASALRAELGRRGIACAVQSTESVFDTAEAEQLERLLLAVAAPHRAATLKAALLSELIGFSVQQLQALESDEREWEQLLSAFERYHELWRTRGFMRMFRELAREQRIVQRLAGEPNGERRLTNLFHLAELAHAEQRRLQGMESLLAWLRGQRGEKAADESQLRLESDAALVQIVTIHASKGLEYPVVFLPFLWNAKSFIGDDADLIVHHDEQPPHALRLDGRAQDLPQALRLAREEELSERLRLAYVALTRAKNRCYLFSGPFKELAMSPLGVLLHGLRGADAQTEVPVAARLLEQLRLLAAASGGSIRVIQTDDSAAEIVLRRVAESAEPLSARLPQRTPPPGFSVSSYTRLLQDAEGLASEHAVEVLPDHDQRAEPAAVPALAPGGGRFAFPRGAAAGTCLHAIFEHIDASTAPASWRRAVAAQLRIAGFPVDWAPALIDWLAEIVATPMICPASAAPVQLAQLPPTRVIAELAFHLPLPGVLPAQIAELANAHGLPISPLSPRRLQGYLRGFIDLCFEHRGRWYIADYKSNWLGTRFDDYAVDSLNQAMAEGDYHLQYLLYTLALHRWLTWRVPGYDYEQHFGGVFYLFLRGMDAEGRGVYTSRPPLALIEALDALCRSEVAA